MPAEGLLGEAIGAFFEPFGKERRREKLAGLTPIEQALRRTTRGVIGSVFVLVAPFFLYGLSGVRAYFGALWRSPSTEWLPLVVFVAAFLFFFFKFRDGWKDCGGVPERGMRRKSLTRTLLGTVSAVVLVAVINGRLFGAGNVAVGLGYFVLTAAAALYAMSGIVRFVALSVARNRAIEIVRIHIDDIEHNWERSL